MLLLNLCRLFWILSLTSSLQDSLPGDSIFEGRDGSFIPPETHPQAAKGLVQQWLQEVMAFDLELLATGARKVSKLG